MGFIIQPAIWLGRQPAGLDNGGVISGFRDEVFREHLLCGLEARATVDGVILFDFSGWSPGAMDGDDGDFQRRLRNRLVALNAYLAGFFTEFRRQHDQGPQLMVANAQELITTHGLDAELWVSRDDAVSHLIKVNDASTYERGKPAAEDRRLLRTHVVSTAVVEAAFARLDALLVGPDLGLAEMADLLLRASHAQQNFVPHGALIEAWAVTERVLRVLWDREERTLANPVSSEPRLVSLSTRARRALDGPSPSIACVAAALHKLGVLSSSAYADLDLPRNARNRWMHGLDPVELSPAGASLSAAQTLLRDHQGVDLEVAPELLILPG